MNKKNVIIGFVLFLIISLSYIVFYNFYQKKYENYPNYNDIIKDMKERMIEELNNISIDGRKIGVFYNKDDIELKDIKESIDGRKKIFKGTFVLSNEDFTFEDKITIGYKHNGLRFVFDYAILDGEEKRKMYITDCDNDDAILLVISELENEKYDDISIDNIERVTNSDYLRYENACLYNVVIKEKELGNRYSTLKTKMYRTIECDHDSNCKYLVLRG